MANEVKFLHSAMTGAPSLSGVAGTLIAVLDSCLVNGFGAGTVDSVVIAGGVATVTRSAGHPMEVGAIAEISGAAVAGGSINGQQKVLSVPSGTTYTFDATGLANQTATGTINHKLAALGWTKQYTGTNLAAYKSSNVSATGCLLRVDDTGTQNARVVGYETMSDVNTGTGPFPTSSQVSGGAYWPKSTTADATTRAWVLCGDDRGFVLWTASMSSANGFTSFFGDFNSYKSPDAYGCVLSAANSSVVGGSNSTLDLAYNNAQATTAIWCPRGFSGLGSSMPMVRSSMVAVGTNGGLYSGASGLGYPNPANNALVVAPIMLGETASVACLRGYVPGCYHVPMNAGTTGFALRDSVTGVTGLTGRTLKALPSAQGVMFVDATGPWR